MSALPSSAAVYCRISEDRAGQGLGVARQEADCRAWAERAGWTVAEVYIDNDVGAYSGKPRRAYLRLLEALKAGERDGLVIWHPDRLHRSPLELEHFIEVIEATGVDVGTVTAGSYDLSTPTGRMTARVAGAVARHESEHKAERVRRKHLELAEAGKPAGGGRPFGYEIDRVTVRPGEAVLIQEAAARVLAGESIRSICTDWVGRGVTGARSPVMRPTRLRQVLVSHRIAGIRALGDRVTGPAVWPAIITPEISERLRAILLDASRHTHPAWSGRSHLLSGWLVCGLCGSRMLARRGRIHEPGYVCASGPQTSGCGRMRIAARLLEAVVLERICAALASPEFAAAAQEPTADTEALIDAVRAEEAALEQLARDHYADRMISRAEFLAGREGVQRRLEQARRALAVAEIGHRRSDWVGRPEELRSEWEAMALGQRRAVIGGLIERIEIRRGWPGRFDPDRVKIHWLA